MPVSDWLEGHMLRRIAALVALACLAFAQPVLAQVRLSFHSFNGSMFGRYPHAFIVLEGTLDATGQPVNENYGYTAVAITPAVLVGAVPGEIYVEKPKYIQSTNRHFTVAISDAQYYAIIAEKNRWARAPYLLDTHNCTHFVARIAEMVGLRDTLVPKNLVRKPKAWLNLVARANPQLHARQIP
jgi:hypothetical protein